MVVFTAYDDTAFEQTIEMKVNGSQVFKKEKISCSWQSGEKYYDQLFDEPVDVSSGDKVVLTQWTAKSIDNNTTTMTYYGEEGGSAEHPDNEDQGLFKTEHSSDD